MTSIIKVDNLQNQCGANIINENAGTITIGASGDTITLAAGASQSGFGRSGSVNWDTTPKTTGFTAVNGEGYFANTSGGAFTMTLPAGSAGAIVSVADYTNSFQTNALTITPNGSEKINGGAGSVILSTEGQSLTLLYVDGTEGWKSVQDSTTSPVGNNFITATGGTVTCCGDYKIHTFTGPGTFTVTSAGNPLGSDTVDYLVVAGGGAGGSPGANAYESGGGGAGGLRIASSFPVSVTAFPITVGAGGAGSPTGNNGSNSIFSTITSSGGGKGGPGGVPGLTGFNGGSGGGAGQSSSGIAGTGNTPPVSPPQGNPGSVSPINGRGGGGGGSGTTGTPAGVGGSGTDVTPTFGAAPQPFYIADGPNAGPSSGGIFAGGGGGSLPGQAGGPGGGANGSPNATGIAGIANTGGGGGGITTPFPPGGSGGSGGSGIVLIRYKYQ
jgi:hypothetical protein